MDEIEIDSYEPDYEGKCEVCDQSPTVSAAKNGRIVHSWSLCGPCMFGTAQAIYPSNWNKLDD